MIQRISFGRTCRKQVGTVAKPRQSRRVACLARPAVAAQLTKTITRPTHIVSRKETSTTLLVGEDALQRHCLQTVLGRHGLTVEDATPVDVSDFPIPSSKPPVADAGNSASSHSVPGPSIGHKAHAVGRVTLVQKEKAEHRATGLKKEAHAKPSRKLLRAQQQRTRQDEHCNLAAHAGLVPPPKGRRLALARVVKPATCHYVVRITSEGAVSGAITQSPTCDVAPYLFWDGHPGCSVLMTGPDALEQPGTRPFQQTVLPRKVLFLRLVAVAHTARAALMPWEDTSPGNARTGPAMFVSGYVTEGNVIIVCSAEPEDGGPPILSGATSANLV